MPEINLALEQLCDAFNQHDLDKIMSHFADDCVLEMPRGNQPWGSRSEGRESVRKALATRFEGLPDVHYGNPQHFVDAGANTGISKWTLTGTRLLHFSPWQGHPQGLLLENRGVRRLPIPPSAPSLPPPPVRRCAPPAQPCDRG